MLRNVVVDLRSHSRVTGVFDFGHSVRTRRWSRMSRSAMLAYPFAFGYGGALLVLDWHPLRRFEGCSRWWRDARARRILLEKVPFLLLGGTILPTIAARLNPTGVWVAFQVDGHMNLFERAMQAFYVWPATRGSLGRCSGWPGKMRQAAQEYAASLRIHPAPEAYFAFAELLQQRRPAGGADHNCLAALALDLTPLNRVQAGQVLASLGRSAEAIDQYRTALALPPDLVPALNNLAWILATDPDATNRNGAEAVQLASALVL